MKISRGSQTFSMFKVNLNLKIEAQENTLHNRFFFIKRHRKTRFVLFVSQNVIKMQ